MLGDYLMRTGAIFFLSVMLHGCGGHSASNRPEASDEGGMGAGASAGMSADMAGVGGTGGTHSFMADHGCSSDAECGAGQVCLKYAPTGPAECVSPQTPATSCASLNQRDECCSSTDCAGGTCFATIVAPTGQCGLGGFDSINQCLSDSCQKDGDCAADELCLPPGFGPVRTCMSAGCRSDADCAAAANSACIVFGDRCCNGAGTARSYRPKQLACAYPSDGCQVDEDCPASQYCVVEGGRAHCSADCR